MNWKKWFLLLTFVFVFSIFLTACGSGDDDATENTDGENGAGEEQDTDEQDADKQDADEQVLSINIKSEPPSLHPGTSTDTTSSAVLDQVFEGLTRVNQEGNPEPAMADEIDISNDGLIYTFKIREDAKWTNGDPVTAGDFEYAWKWVLDPENADTDYAYQLYPIKGAEDAKENEGSLDDVGITVEDDHTLVVELEQPTDYFLELTAFHTYYPVNESVVEGNDKWALDVSEDYVSNGPFKLVSWDHKDKIVIEKNEDYWDADTVKLETINMQMIDDEATALQMYENGELDWVGDPIDKIPLAAIPAMKDSGELHISDRAGLYYYTLNHDDELFANKNIRKAFALSINRQGIVENISKGEQKPAMALVPPSMFPESETGYFKDNDVELAKEHLAKGLEELGLDKLPKVKLSYNTDEEHAAIAQAIQDMWKKNLEVDVELNNEEWNVYLDSLSEGNYQIGRIGWIADFNDAINFLELFETVGGNNYTNWESKDYQELLKASRGELDSDKRMEILKEAEELYMEELPIAPVYFYTFVYAYKDHVKGIEVSPVGSFQLKWGYIEVE
ncbi:peptide ABC transporter substrate-binding protein [Pseudogracilibacillus auburnensis]|uniref:Oligopeptide transport system substrate-binding protein n=1 Tax=Pseudogracilibacillus auburnensis TaxID=1494959 RepID=A0A2V3W2N7_9BACI|nr:peptide ABC transporter substrate-binding protein [Pseudogracilibacillus auburnensis]MBO1002130.1 peptide ABC transporter substrate-binding protein [Pseudogracilibacillus auburnensis]PXW87454.1 oligopeptide transport system substrate-binding protein [Pseudogracilibacillus auburnensis]